MVVRQQRLDPLLVQHRRHELAGDVAGDQPLAVLGEHRNVPNHGKTVMLFQTEERSGQNPELKQFAQKTLPILQTHQKMAQELSRKVRTASAR